MPTLTIEDQGGTRRWFNSASGETFLVAASFDWIEDFVGDPASWASRYQVEGDGLEPGDPGRIHDAYAPSGIDSSSEEAEDRRRAEAPNGGVPVPGGLGVGWTIEEYGGGRVQGVIDEPTGAVALSLNAVEQAQLARISWGDAGGFLATGSLQIEFRLKFKVLPTSGTLLAFGFGSELKDDPDNIATNVMFKLDGSGAILAETDDGTTDTDDGSTGVTATADDQYRIFRINWGSVYRPAFYVGASNVAVASSDTMAAVTTTDLLRPFVQISKLSGTSVGTVELDKIRVWGDR